MEHLLHRLYGVDAPDYYIIIILAELFASVTRDPSCRRLSQPINTADETPVYSASITCRNQWLYFKGFYVNTH